jgi:hypothetical protein
MLMNLGKLWDRWLAADDAEERGTNREGEISMDLGPPVPGLPEAFPEPALPSEGPFSLEPTLEPTAADLPDAWLSAPRLITV